MSIWCSSLDIYVLSARKVSNTESGSLVDPCVAKIQSTSHAILRIFPWDIKFGAITLPTPKALQTVKIILQVNIYL